MAPALPDFHDAVLLEVLIDFEAGVADLRLGLVGDTERVARVRCTGFGHVSVERELPWGPSSWVNGLSRGDGRLDIEMQSGDCIVVRGKEMTVAVIQEDNTAS